MLTTHPHLRARRPSPTTVEYTVSTSPTLTLPLRLLLLLTIFLRLLIGLSVLLFLYSKYLLTTLSTLRAPILSPPPLLTTAFLSYTLQSVTLSPVGLLFTQAAHFVPLFLLLPFSLALLYTISLRLHTTESLLVLRGLGLQTSTSSTTYLSTATTRFIPTENVQDILVNEAFRGFEVRYYLVVVVEGEDDVVVVFPRLLPGRSIVERVWRGARGCLVEPVGGVSGGEKNKEKDINKG